MALCRKGSPDKKLFDLGRGLSLDQIGSPLPPHCARVSLKNERWRSGRKAPKVSLLSASGVDSTEGILISPSRDNRDGPPRAQRTTEGHFSVLWALHWCFFCDCYVYSYSFLFSSHPATSSICFCSHVSPPVTASLCCGATIATPSLYPTAWHRHRKQPLLSPPASCSRLIRQQCPRRGWTREPRRGSLQTPRLSKHMVENFWQ